MDNSNNSQFWHKHFYFFSTDDNQCLDYLHVTRLVFNDDYCTCGRVGISGQTFDSLGIPKDGMEFERISMTHRSNSDCRGFGTLATVTCIDIAGLLKRKRQTCRPTFIVPRLRETHPPLSKLVSFVKLGNLIYRQWNITARKRCASIIFKI